jgi:hypothetical protein
MQDGGPSPPLPYLVKTTSRDSATTSSTSRCYHVVALGPDALIQRETTFYESDLFDRLVLTIKP